jgi:hypothetical protein
VPEAGIGGLQAGFKQGETCLKTAATGAWWRNRGEQLVASARQHEQRAPRGARAPLRALRRQV